MAKRRMMEMSLCSLWTKSLLLLLFFGIQTALAQKVKGRITDPFGAPLPYASVYVKGNSKGTVANSEGLYQLELGKGTHALVCAYVGYQKMERRITLEQADEVVDFQLPFQQTELGEAVVKAGGEDPAYAIIRQAIKKRKDHLNEVNQWEVLVYIKGLIRTFALPTRVFGVELNPNRDVVDSSGKGIVYFSESLTRFLRRLPSEAKEEVISAKVSGNSNGFGFNSPSDMEINLYENNISISGVGNRGFISPIAENALYFYKYKFDGSYYEDGKEVNRIRVIPKRKYEPVFAGGYIEILEGSWRVHGVDLHLTKLSQLELVDSLHIRQQLFPVGQIWLPQKTEIYATFGALGFRAGANFVSVYSQYNLESDMRRTLSDKVIKRVDTSANKRSVAYWESLRPMPLTEEERKDYLRKDTLERRFQDPRYLDSLDRIRNKVTAMKLMVRGTSHINRYKRQFFRLPGLVTGIQYNTVEGWAYELQPTFSRWGDTGAYSISGRFRYGFGNKHFNAMGTYSHTIGKNYNKRYFLTVSGGKYTSQINPANPIQPWNNTFGTLLYTVNYMKIYEKAFGTATVRHRLRNGVRLGLTVSMEDRMPLENTDTNYMWRRHKNRSFTPNYPQEVPEGNFDRHQAFLTTFDLRWQPGVRFMEYPNRRETIPSKWPIIRAQATKAWDNVFGSDANFGRWRLSAEDEMDMKLGGSLNYYVETGGFTKSKKVQLPDWRHFNGNQTIVAAQYGRSFQLAPYYANSTNEGWYANGHVEWHLNGLVSNKIPLFRKLNWHFVTGANALYVDADRNYVEVFVGIENIFKTIRVDWVNGYDGVNKKATTGIVIGFGGLFAGVLPD